MSALSAHTPDTRSSIPASEWAKQTLWIGFAAQIALFVPSYIAWFYDDRLINDISVWDKPMKFAISLTMLMVTVIPLLPLLNEAERATRMVRWSALAIAFFGFIEILYIVLQSSRGRASHFNNSTPVESIAYGFMGLGAISIVVGAFCVGLAIWRAKPESKGQGQGLWLGAALGLMAGAVLTVITAGLMSSGQITAPGHWVGGIRSDANGLFLLGWSTSGGDLRVPHFFATHLMQALPILGLLADRFTPTSAKTIVWAGLGFGVLVVIATFAQAMSGTPFLAG